MRVASFVRTAAAAAAFVLMAVAPGLAQPASAARIDPADTA
jgi:hypothetical protein